MTSCCMGAVSLGPNCGLIGVSMSLSLVLAVTERHNAVQ